MMNPVRHKRHGITIEEDLALRPGELAIDAVGLWQIVPAGREGFGLSGSALYDYVRRHILNLLAKGAKPVRGVKQGPRFWRVVEYGNTPEEIADAIIAEWKASGHEPDPGGVWFALPHIYEATTQDAKAGDRKFHS